MTTRAVVNLKDRGHVGGKAKQRVLKRCAARCCKEMVYSWWYAQEENYFHYSNILFIAILYICEAHILPRDKNVQFCPVKE